MHTDTVITAKTAITPGNILPVSHLAILCITIKIEILLYCIGLHNSRQQYYL